MWCNSACRLSLGVPVLDSRTVDSIVAGITSNQGGFVKGSGSVAFTHIADTIADMISPAMGDDAETPFEGQTAFAAGTDTDLDLTTDPNSGLNLDPESPRSEQSAESIRSARSKRPRHLLGPVATAKSSRQELVAMCHALMQHVTAQKEEIRLRDSRIAELLLTARGAGHVGAGGSYTADSGGYAASGTASDYADAGGDTADRAASGTASGTACGAASGAAGAMPSPL